MDIRLAPARGRGRAPLCTFSPPGYSSGPSPFLGGGLGLFAAARSVGGISRAYSYRLLTRSSAYRRRHGDSLGAAVPPARTGTRDGRAGRGGPAEPVARRRASWAETPARRRAGKMPPATRKSALRGRDDITCAEQTRRGTAAAHALPRGDVLMRETSPVFASPPSSNHRRMMLTLPLAAASRIPISTLSPPM